MPITDPMAQQRAAEPMNASSVEKCDDECRQTQRVTGREAEERRDKKERTSERKTRHEAILAMSQARDGRGDKGEVEVETAHQPTDGEKTVSDVIQSAVRGAA